MKKLIAGLMTALMATLSLVSPVLAATALGDYPGFLAGSDGALDAYVVIGSDAAVSDVVGAVDLASRLAEVGEGTTTEECAGSAVSVDGITKDTITVQRGYLDNFFPGTIRSFHYDKLATSTISWNGNNYDYYEGIALGNDLIYTSHDFSTSGINGTQTMVIPTNVLKYQYAFKKALNLTSKSDLGTISSPEYTYPINVELLGKSFQIVGIGANQIKMLAGSVGTATATTPVEYQDYSVYSDLGSNNAWARVIVKDSDGNTVATEVINDGSDKSLTDLSLTVKVTDVRALTDGTVVGADLVVGAINAVEKTYPSSCDISGTGASDYRFPDETEWCIQATTSGSTNSGNLAVDDVIEVVYKPSTTKYVKMTDADPAISLPNGYGKVGFVGWNYDTWTELTIQPVSGKTVYWDDGLTGATNSTLAASNLNGIEIAATPGGSIVWGSNGYDKVYILFNYSYTDIGGATVYPVMVGFWDSVNSRIGTDIAKWEDNATDYYEFLSDHAGYVNEYKFNWTISYSNGAAVGDQQFINITVHTPANSTLLNNVTSAASYFTDFFIGQSGQYNDSVRIQYQNKTTTWSTTTAPEFRLYTSGSGQSNDVTALSTDTSGTAQVAAVGVSTQDVVTDGGAIIVNPNSYSGADTVKVKVPAQLLYVKMYVGELGGTTAGSEVSYTSYPSVPITSAIAKLDTEMSALKTAKHVILVGGPCINDLVAELADAGTFSYTCDTWPGRDFGLIQAVDDGFATDKVALVVAGTQADDTRTATSALQLYDTKLSGLTGGSVEVTGSVGSPSVTEV